MHRKDATSDERKCTIESLLASHVYNVSVRACAREADCGAYARLTTSTSPSRKLKNAAV